MSKYVTVPRESQADFILKDIREDGPVEINLLAWVLDCPVASVRRALHSLRKRGHQVLLQNGLVDIRDQKRR